MPTSLLGLVLFLVLLAPGFAFTLRRERVRSGRTLSAFRETTTVALVSVAANGAVLALFAVLRIVFPSWTPDVGALVREPQRYAVEHYAQLLSWGVGLLAVATLVAFAAGGRRGKEHESGVSAWTLLFTAHPDAKVFVGCVLDDGSYVAGRLLSFSRAAEDVADRELTLTGPITYRAPEKTETSVLPDVGATAISARRIVLLNVSYLPDDAES
ncbi:DUF6338 family protein [Saccharothrix deserti]|uniref:DUF6338 family protein n=1 Tax=Saccharothrix deserti TaxID=2593674 RepID=UPI00131B9E92|nr:DUF6338 family protein [Saccharothrix deserti]